MDSGGETALMFHLWNRHHLRPGVYWLLSKGERKLLRAFSEKELELATGSVDKR